MQVNNLKQQAYEHIRRKLLVGRMSPGARLSDVELSKEIGISRTPVREAISQLESDGLVEQVPRFGAFIKKLERADLEEIYDLRELLEGFTAERAAARMSEQMVAELGGYIRSMRQIARHVREVGSEKIEQEQVEKWVLLDAAFHLSIIEAAGSPRVMKIVSDFQILTHTFFSGAPFPSAVFPRNVVEILRDHGRVYLAIKRHDSQAAGHWMRYHLNKAKQRMVQRLETLGKEDSVSTRPFKIAAYRSNRNVQES